MPRVVGIPFEPVKCVAGDLECQLVAGHCTHDARGIDDERRAIDVFFVSKLLARPALRVDDPVEPALFLSRITRSRKATP